MASQSASRKRSAPGVSSSLYQPHISQNMNGYNNGIGSQLSDDQFLQWGQAAQPSNSYQEPTAYASAGSNYPSHDVTAATQLARRPIAQMVPRARASDSGVGWVDPLSAQAQLEDAAWGDDLEELEQKAHVAKHEAQSKRKQIPPFVQKLNSFLEDGKNTDLIRWSEDGNSFIVLDEDEFAKTLIPELFKHNNYASFVRQLNMYGFHKKVGLSDNSMRASERKNKSPSEYSNPYFRRGHPDLLWLIQKPKNITATNPKTKTKVKAEDQIDDDGDDFGDDAIEMRSRPRPQLAIGHGESTLSQEQLQNVSRELAAIRHQQAQISRMMQALRREHEQLYGQAATFQDQHNRHENSINAILTFLATVYNRSLQGHEGAPGITNLFPSAIPHEASQANVVDVGDFNFGDAGLGKPFKKQPLLLKGPPSGVGGDRASTASPAPNSTQPHHGRQTRRMSQVLQTGHTPPSGNVEELLDSSANTPLPNNSNFTTQPQQDIMSVIRNTNARNSEPGTPAADFSNVLNSLQNSGGQSPLTSSQRADMLRLINNSSNQVGDNALVNATPPSMPNNYDRRLASTRADLDSLAKLQAEQDRSVQNLTSLLQPLSPTGSIPGIGDGVDVAPPPLDIDAFLNHNDYFTDFPTDENSNFDFDNTTNGDGFSFPNYNNDDEELFAGVQPKSEAADENGVGGGRVESVASSEVTTPSPADTIDNVGVNGRSGPTTRAKGRRMSSAEDADGGDRESPKRRRRNN